VGEWWSSARSFLSEGLWRQEFEPRTWAARGAAVLQFGIMVGEGFVRDQLLLRASALTYFAVLSLVPLLAIVSSVLTAMGITENVVTPIVEQVLAGAPEVGDRVLDFVQTANIGGLGTLGAATLFLTTVLGISNIEGAFNHIWGVKQVRPWARRIPDYLAVLIVAPLLLGVGLSLATTVKSQWIVQRLMEYRVFELIYDAGLQQAPKVMMALAFGFLFWFLPNTTVRPFAALLGGVVSALLVDLGMSVYVGMSVGATRANALYGIFAQIPLAFVWIYLFSAIVLFGAEIAFAYQNLPLYRREVRAERAGPAEREAIGLRIAVEIGRSFRDGRPPWTEDELSDALQVPVRTVRSVLVPLQVARVVSPVDGSERDGGWQLGRPADRIQVVDVLGALRGSREAAAGDPQVRQAVDAVLAELAEWQSKAAAGLTLAQLLDGVPPAGDAAGR
jgi:membrane protein